LRMPLTKSGENNFFVSQPTKNSYRANLNLPIVH
jgi:hypothetical protein